MNGGFFGPLLRAGLFAQVILLVLFTASIVCWAVIIGKARNLGKARKQTRQFLNIFRYHGRITEHESLAKDHPESPLSSLLTAGLKEWNALLDQLRGVVGRAELMRQLIPNVTEAMERAASRQLDRLESRMSFLAITASVAPFLGLLGTVQGVLRSFLAMRAEELVTLQRIAPGISDALITTVVGLIVAIPAAIFYNSFVARVRDLNSEMERFTSELTGMFRREIVASHLDAPPPQHPGETE